eukprot:4237900-Pleurochrysis_carterae.AAC.1
MRTATVPALRETRVPRTGCGFALLFACVPGRVRTLRSVVLRCSGLVSICLLAAFRYERFAL